MLRKVRIMIASIMFIAVTLLFLDFTGVLHHWLGWTAQIQFLPAILALNLAVVIALLLVTFVLGRIYCSVICPLGIFQDIAAWLGTRRKHSRNKYHYTKAKTILRYSVLGVFVVLMLAGVSSVAVLVAPYSAFGRIAQNLFAPVYQAGNNVLAYFAERADSYAFYPVEVWIRSAPTFVIALATFIVLFVLAWRGGRTWCNTICPVGTLLGTVSRFSLFKPVIDKSKCIKCHACEKRCKAACIDIDNQSIDTSRCVVCMNCIDNCHKGAVRYMFSFGKKSVKPGKTQEKSFDTKDSPETEKTVDKSETGSESEREVVSPVRRGFLLSLPGMALGATTAFAQDNKTTDGGMAELKPRQHPDRGEFSLKPAGSRSFSNFSKRCVGCQLCVVQCPNGVLRPSESLLHLMQPEMQFDKGFCRPECNRCSEVCPAGAIEPVTVAEKSSTQIGHAVWSKALCIAVSTGTKCGNCARHCPNGAIEMIETEGPNGEKVEVPSVDTERCIGCGACEYVCPVRPVSAIYVVGHEVHKVN